MSVSPQLRSSWRTEQGCFCLGYFLWGGGLRKVEGKMGGGFEVRRGENLLTLEYFQFITSVTGDGFEGGERVCLEMKTEALPAVAVMFQ